MSETIAPTADPRFVVRLTGARRRGVRRRVSQRLAARLDIPVERVQSLLRRPDGIITRPLPYETAREIWMLFMYEGLDAEMDELPERTEPQEGQEPQVDLYKTSTNLRLTSVVERPLNDGSASFPSAESFFGRSGGGDGGGWEQPPSEAKGFTVRLIVRVPPPMLEHVVRRLEQHLSIDPDRLRKLLQRPPGPITKAVTRTTAERLTSLLTAEGLVVETVDLGAEGGDASLTDTAYRDLRLTMERPAGRPPPARRKGPRSAPATPKRRPPAARPPNLPDLPETTPTPAEAAPTPAPTPSEPPKTDPDPPPSREPERPAETTRTEPAPAEPPPPDDLSTPADLEAAGSTGATPSPDAPPPSVLGRRGRTPSPPTPADPEGGPDAPPAPSDAEEGARSESAAEPPRPFEVTTSSAPVERPSAEMPPASAPPLPPTSEPEGEVRSDPSAAPPTAVEAPIETPSPSAPRLGARLGDVGGRVGAILGSWALRAAPWAGLVLLALFARFAERFASNTGMLLHLLVSTLLIAAAASLVQRDRLRDLLTAVAALPLLLMFPFLVHAVRPWSDLAPTLQGVSVAGLIALVALIAARALRYDRVALGIGLGTLLQDRLEGERRPLFAAFRLRAAIFTLRVLVLIALAAVGGTVVPRLASLPSAAPLIGELSLVVVAFTVAQELLFRGVLQRAAVRALGAPIGLLFATLAFVAAVLAGGDAALASLPLAALFGAALALAAHVTGSIWGGVALQLVGALVLTVGAEPLLACASSDALLSCLGTALDGVGWIP